MTKSSRTRETTMRRANLGTNLAAFLGRESADMGLIFESDWVLAGEVPRTASRTST